MKIPLEEENKVIEPFKTKNTRADLRYQPLCKDLKDVVHTGDLSKKENRDVLAHCIENYI